MIAFLARCCSGQFSFQPHNFGRLPKQKKTAHFLLTPTAVGDLRRLIQFGNMFHAGIRKIVRGILRTLGPRSPRGS